MAQVQPGIGLRRIQRTLGHLKAGLDADPGPLHPRARGAEAHRADRTSPIFDTGGEAIDAIGVCTR